MARHNQQQKAQQYRVYGNELSMTKTHGRPNGCSPQDCVKAHHLNNEKFNREEGAADIAAGAGVRSGTDKNLKSNRLTMAC